MLGDGDGIGMGIRCAGTPRCADQLAQALAVGGGGHPAIAELHMRRHLERAGYRSCRPTPDWESRSDSCCSIVKRVDAKIGPVAHIPGHARQQGLRMATVIRQRQAGRGAARKPDGRAGRSIASRPGESADRTRAYRWRRHNGRRSARPRKPAIAISGDCSAVIIVEALREIDIVAGIHRKVGR